MWFFMFLWIYSCFILYLKDLILVFKIIFKLVFIPQLVVIFKYVQIFFKSYFWKSLPTLGRMVERRCLICPYWISFKLVHDKGGRYELYTWSSCYCIFVYSYMFFIYVCFKFQVAILFSYIHICDLNCAYFTIGINFTFNWYQNLFCWLQKISEFVLKVISNFQNLFDMYSLYARGA